MTTQTRPPVHESLHVETSERIYRNEDWWKAVVRYKYDGDNEYEETAVYLWHNDDGWTRKNKYVIKTEQAWETDKAIVEQLFSDSAGTVSSEDFPVSDYYGVASGETVFQSDGWWKAILKISEKGSYETDEVMIYLWQEVDGEWRRRQKYTIKSQERWADEQTAIESVLDIETTSEPDVNVETVSSDDEEFTQPEEFEQLSREIDKHLSEHPTE